TAGQHSIKEQLLGIELGGRDLKVRCCRRPGHRGEEIVKIWKALTQLLTTKVLAVPHRQIKRFEFQRGVLLRLQASGGFWTKGEDCGHGLQRRLNLRAFRREWRGINITLDHSFTI